MLSVRIASLIVALASCWMAASTPLKLAVTPKCTKASGAVGDVNVGLKPLSQFKNIISFGDSYSEPGSGLTNGPTWNELLAKESGAKLTSYANSGALADYSQYIGFNPGETKDFQQQVDEFIWSTQWDKINASETLYTVFLGMEDFIKSKGFTQPEPVAISGIVEYTLLTLASYPIRAQNILILDNYGRGQSSEAGDYYREQVFIMADILSKSRQKVNVAFANLANIWEGVLGENPGYEAFGYTSAGTCLSERGVCADPEHTFYWADGNPTAATHALIAQYVKEVVGKC